MPQSWVRNAAAQLSKIGREGCGVRLHEDGARFSALTAVRSSLELRGGIHGVRLTHRILVSFCLGEPACEVVDSALEFLGVSERLIKVQHISGDTGAAAAKEFGRPGEGNPAVELSEIGGH
jgi:hypothetical protein